MLNEAINFDQEELHLASIYPYYAGGPCKSYSSLLAGQGPSLLDYPLEFMTHDELYKWLVREIWQDAVARGVKTKGGQIKFKDENFRPSFWPWAQTKHLSKVNKRFWTTLNLNIDFVTFMKITIQRCLAEKNIDPDLHINPNYEKEILKRRKRKRGVPASPQRSSSETSSLNSNTVNCDLDENATYSPGNQDRGGRFVLRRYSPEQQLSSPSLSLTSPSASQISPECTPSHSSSPITSSLPSPTEREVRLTPPPPSPPKRGRRLAPEVFNQNETIPTPPVRTRRERRLRTPPPSPEPMVTRSQTRSLGTR